MNKTEKFVNFTGKLAERDVTVTIKHVQQGVKNHDLQQNIKFINKSLWTV